jgi:hypothetical protein
VPHLHVYKSNDVHKRKSMKERTRPKQRKRIDESASKTKQRRASVSDHVCEVFFPGTWREYAVTCSVVNTCFRWLLSFIWLAPVGTDRFGGRGRNISAPPPPPPLSPSSPQTEKWLHPVRATIFGLFLHVHQGSARCAKKILDDVQQSNPEGPLEDFL